MDRNHKGHSSSFAYCGTQKWNVSPWAQWGEDCSCLGILEEGEQEQKGWMGCKEGREQLFTAGCHRLTSCHSGNVLFRAMGTQVFVDFFFPKTKCKLDFKPSICLKLETMSLRCCRVWQKKGLIASKLLFLLIIVITHRLLTWWSKHEVRCFYSKLSSPFSDL